MIILFFSELISENPDLLLIKNSSFLLGHRGLLTEIAYLFNVPVMLLNMYQLFEGYPKKNVIGDYLKKSSLKKKKFLSMNL